MLDWPRAMQSSRVKRIGFACRGVGGILHFGFWLFSLGTRRKKSISRPSASVHPSARERMYDVLCPSLITSLKPASFAYFQVSKRGRRKRRRRRRESERRRSVDSRLETPSRRRYRDVIEIEARQLQGVFQHFLQVTL